MKKASLYLNITCIVIPILVLVGWQFSIDFFKRPIPGAVFMNPVTAMGILMASLSFYISSQNMVKWLTLARLLAGFMLLFAVAKFVTAILGINVPIQPVFFRQQLSAELGHNSSNITSPNALFCVILIGIALFMYRSPNEVLRRVANYLAMVVLLVGLFSLIGYMYHVKEYYSLPSFYPMAVHTAFCFVCLALAILFANHDVGFMVVLSNPNVAGRIARLLVPATVLVPITLGYFWVLGQTYLNITPEFGVSLLIINFVAIFFTLIWYVSVALNQGDIARIAAEEELKRKNETLEFTQERLRLATEGTAAGIWDWIDVKQDTNWWSPRLYELLGYSEQELPPTTQSFTMILHPDDVEKSARLMEEHFKHRARYEIEYRLKTRSGVYKWFLATGQAKFDEQGKAVRMVGSVIDIDERRKAENVLLEQSALIQIVPDAIMTMDLMRRVTSWNEGAERLFGIQAKEAIGQMLHELMKIRTAEELQDKQRAELIANGFERHEAILETREGKKLDVLSTTKVVKDTEGKITGWVAVNTDITSLKRNEERLQLATEGTSAGIWDWMDMSRDEEWWAARFYELLGYSNNEIPASAQTFKEMMHPDDFDRIAKKLTEHFNKKTRFEIEARLKTKSGAYKWFLGTGQVRRNEIGIPVRMVGSIIDIDEQKRTRDIIEQQAALIKMLPDGIVFYSKGMKFADLNAGAEKMFDLKREEVVGKELNDFITFTMPRGERFEDSLGQLWQTGFYRGEIMITNRSTGKAVNVLVNIKKMENASGAEPLFMAIYTDLSPLRMNEELKHALKSLETNNQYLEQFAYISAHDIKAPIITISGLLELMIKSNAVKEEHSEVLKMLTNSVKQVQRTNHSLNNILKLRKNLMVKDHASDQSFTLRTILDDVLAGLQHDIEQANATVVVELNELADVHFQYVYVKSIFYNLLNNAIKYRDPARQLKITAEAQKIADGRVRFVISDNGLGIDLKKNKGKMFGIFKRFHTHVEGTGVGLHIVKSIVDEYNGTIEVESTQGEGTRFVIEFDDNILA